MEQQKNEESIRLAKLELEKNIAKENRSNMLQSLGIALFVTALILLSFLLQKSSKNLDHAMGLQNILQDHIEHRLKHYTKCITKSTENYFKYLLETYNRQLAQKIRLNIDE